MFSMKVFCVLAVVMLVGGVLACGQSPPSESEKSSANQSPNKFVVGPSAVLMPQGRFLLIRKEGKLGAIRFTSIEQDSASGTGKATYESYFQGDGSGSFVSSNVRKQTGEVTVKPLKGFHPFAFQTGKTKISVGEWSFECYGPGLMFMYPYAKSAKDYGYEFAPTSAQRVEEINGADKWLKWFRYDPNARVELSVSELGKLAGKFSAEVPSHGEVMVTVKPWTSLKLPPSVTSPAGCSRVCLGNAPKRQDCW